MNERQVEALEELYVLLITRLCRLCFGFQPMYTTVQTELVQSWLDQHDLGRLAIKMCFDKVIGEAHRAAIAHESPLQTKAEEPGADRPTRPFAPAEPEGYGALLDRLVNLCRKRGFYCTSARWRHGGGRVMLMHREGARGAVQEVVYCDDAKQAMELAEQWADERDTTLAEGKEPPLRADAEHAAETLRRAPGERRCLSHGSDCPGNRPGCLQPDLDYVEKTEETPSAT